MTSHPRKTEPSATPLWKPIHSPTVIIIAILPLHFNSTGTLHPQFNLSFLGYFFTLLQPYNRITCHSGEYTETWKSSHVLNVLTRHLPRKWGKPQKPWPDSNAVYNSHLQSTSQENYYSISMLSKSDTELCNKSVPEIFWHGYLPREDAKTTPKPIANGPPILRNLSLGAQTATADRPPTTPAVYLWNKFTLWYNHFP